MLHRRKAKATIFQWTQGQETDILEPLRYVAACKLRVWHEHQAGGGSFYVTIGDRHTDGAVSLKLRFADHDNTSLQYRTPDFNFVDRIPSEQELQEIVDRIQHARLCKKTAFAMHAGLTVPKLKTLLRPDCFESVCENEDYPNTFTQYVVVAVAYQALETGEITVRNPVRQELYTYEDYCGF